MKNTALRLVLAACVYMIGLIVGTSFVPQHRIPLMVVVPFVFWTLAFGLFIIHTAFVWESSNYDKIRKEIIERQLKLDETVRVLQEEVANLRRLRNLPYGSE